MCRGRSANTTLPQCLPAGTRILGAYWRGDAKNEQLAAHLRTAWATRRQLAALFSVWKKPKSRISPARSQSVWAVPHPGRSAGMCSWHPMAGTIYQVLLSSTCATFQRVSGLLKRSRPRRWDRASGALRPLEHYSETCSPPERESRDYAIKPMNCPLPLAGVQSGPEELPRAATASGRVRLLPPYEPSGSLHGLCAYRGLPRTTTANILLPPNEQSSPRQPTSQN